MPDEVFTYGGTLSIERWESGTEYVVKEPSDALWGHAQVIIRARDGLVLQITSGGLAGKRAPRPLSSDSLLDLCRKADQLLARGAIPEPASADPVEADTE
jgi:hypothetical protein